MKPKFSIVIPTYNRVLLLQRTLESALSQEGDLDYQVVVVDDASQDETWALLQRLRDPRLVVLRSPARLGMGANWNKAVRASSGEYVYLLQDDDLAERKLLKRISQALERHGPVDLVCFSTCLVDADEQNQRIFWSPAAEEILLPPGGLLYFSRTWMISSTQLILARSVFDRYGGFDETSPIMSDAEAILRWMVHCRVLLLPEPLARRRVWEGAVTAATRHSAAMAETMQYLVKRVSSEAACAGNLSPAQVAALKSQLVRTFVLPYRQTRRERLRKRAQPVLESVLQGISPKHRL